MDWQGLKIREISKEKDISLTSLANDIGVSRQTINEWILGKVPKGLHLLKLSRALNVKPDVFFNVSFDDSIIIPSHRKRGTAKVNNKMQEYSFELAKEYQLLFKNAKDSYLAPVLKTTDRSLVCAQSTAMALRELVGVNEDTPINYFQTFTLMEKLQITVIFRSFPDEIKSYAFFTKIFGHRVVFVNTATNILDLIFPLLHESVHAVRDYNSDSMEYDQEEEDFCDLVANLIQFPKGYVEYVHNLIKNAAPGRQINILKSICDKSGHSLFGICKNLSFIDPKLNLKVSGADTNLKKSYPTIGHIIYGKVETERQLLEKIKKFSPNFVKILATQNNDFSNRRIAELLNFDSSLDGRLLKIELLNINNIS